eukprot:GGOE01033933.1.p1 GENE.GGOE01033933.1~~GGOE01033933.1.p1  ORF type:complete len:361 (-),score=-36.41 GGOE01033933.1:174-1256(-)
MISFCTIPTFHTFIIPIPICHRWQNTLFQTKACPPSPIHFAYTWTTRAALQPLYLRCSTLSRTAHTRGVLDSRPHLWPVCPLSLWPSPHTACLSTPSPRFPLLAPIPPPVTLTSTSLVKRNAGFVFLATLVLRCQWHQPCALCPPPYPPPRLCFSCARQESARCRFPPCAPWRVTSAQLPPHCSRSPSDPLIRLPLSASLRQCWRCGVTGFLCSMGVALPRGPPKTLPLTSKKLNLQPHRQSDVVLPSPSPCVMHRQWHTGAPPPISSLCPSAWADCLGSRRLLRFPSAPSVWMEPLRPGRPFPQDCCGKSHGTKVDPPDTLHMAGAYALCDAQDAPPSALVRMPRVWHCVTHVHVCHVN